MNSIQLAIIAGIVILIIITVGYYWYQEAKFRRMVENNFNHTTKDVINQEKPMILDGVIHKNAGIPKAKSILQKDSYIHDIHDIHDDVLPEPFKIDIPSIDKEGEDGLPSLIPEDSAEAFFVKLDNILFPFDKEVDSNLDYIIDIVFEDSLKIKVLPELSQFTAKAIKCYVLNQEQKWQAFERGNKYNASALKFVISLVDKNGVVSQAQLANIYNQLHKFVLNNNGHIRQSEYQSSLASIHQQLKYITDVKLSLDLFLVAKNKISGDELAGFFVGNGLKNRNGIFEYYLPGDDRPAFRLQAEQGLAFRNENSYNLLLISTDLHFTSDPKAVVGAIFDLSELFMASFESRLLTSQKQVFSQKDYDNLCRYVDNYVGNADKNGIKLGGDLLLRVF